MSHEEAQKARTLNVLRLFAAVWAHLGNATIKSESEILPSPHDEGVGRVRERGNPMITMALFLQPLSPSLSPLVPRGERESSRAMVSIYAAASLTRSKCTASCAIHGNWGVQA